LQANATSSDRPLAALTWKCEACLRRDSEVNTDFQQETTEEAEERHEIARNFRKATGRFGAGKQGRKMEAETLSETKSFQPRMNANEREYFSTEGNEGRETS